MKKAFLNLSILLSILFVNSCIHFSQSAFLNPVISDYESNNIHPEQKISIRIKDRRQIRVFGKRGNGILESASINNYQNLENILEGKIKRLFESKGFLVENGQEKLVKLEIIKISYKSLMGIFTVGSKVEVVLRAEVLSFGNSVYKESYSISEEERYVLFPPTASQNEEFINKTFENCLKKFLNDRKIIDILIS